jgi:hypothetical protein
MRYLPWAGFSLLAYATIAIGSSGALDAQGCHNDPVTGVHHCHRSPAEVQAGASSAVETFSSGGVDVPQDDDVYLDCAEVRAAGAAPLRTGEVGYSKRLDPDGDGVACE